ncbi:tail fiber protein [Winogradskyella phage Peternella_1]|uniref:Tail fiber protein n=1 Tax=Winogradskyella phage Peternella_1 TaxID=2745699 RepID=A0A8E4ZE65_9CAUD|nr:tail fiber protein [Winogradskyella phage Peternella_1]QQV91596.1 tail fiber protein [Winogradskyella phage Peternella_1]
MDKLIISSTGVPGAIELLEFLESASHDQINALVKAIGNNVIFDGIEDDDGQTSDGWLIYSNEILPFVSSVTGETVVIKEIVTTAAYDDTQTGSFDQIQPIWKKRHCEFGDPDDADVVASFAFDTLTRVRTLQVLNALLTQATEEQLGLVEIATQDEANTNTNDTHALTPKKLNERNATASRRGVVELASLSEIQAGTDEERALTIKLLRDAGYRVTKVTSGSAVTENRDGGELQNDYSKNYKDIYPPTGYTMANLVAFEASIAEIYFSGNVDDNDILWCNYDVLTNSVRVICNNRENRANSKINYIAIWQK